MAHSKQAGFFSRNFKRPYLYSFHITKSDLYFFNRTIAMSEVPGHKLPKAAKEASADANKPVDGPHDNKKLPTTMAHGVFLVVDSSFLDTTFDQAEHCPDH